MARPQKEVDTELVRKLAQVGCTNKDIADVVGISHDTLTRRFMAELDAGRAQGRVSLRRKQMEQALSGNTAMLIWLGKQILGQSDKVQTETTINDVTLTFGNAEVTTPLQSDVDADEMLTAAETPTADDDHADTA